MDKLYGKYFQKSRSFLYPVLGIPKKTATPPLGTYVSLEGMYPPEEMKKHTRMYRVPEHSIAAASGG